MKILKRIGVFSCAKIFCVFYAAVGLLIGLIVSLASIVGAGLGMASGASDIGLAGLIFGVAAIIIFPIFYGIVGFIAGALSSFIYNLVARFTGGIELELV